MLRYKGGELCFGESEVSLAGLVQDKEHPIYVYDLAGIKNQVDRFYSALGGKAELYYAMKANSHPKILQLMAQLGHGADVVSGGEIELALEAGIPAERIIFSGVAKSREEIALAIDKQIGQINVESLSELRRIGKISAEKNQEVRVAFRLNPDVNAETHPYITTGFRENKFGMRPDDLPSLLEVMESNKQLVFRGLTIHIGSQLLDLEDFREAIEKTVTVVKDLEERGYKVESFDVGGGLGIDYKRGLVHQELVEEYGKLVQELLSPLGCRIFCEPGRILTACSGVLLAKIEYLKTTEHRNFAIVNTGMHHLMRPALYEAYHRILPVKEGRGARKTYDVVGPICESSDFLGRGRKLSGLAEGDWLAIGEAGAYGMTMASRYNAHDFPDEIVLEVNS